ncbi:MAG: SpoIIE family protein phosphatase [Actinomycetota bacterium]|nr:SpoIIE family protein phosphatase [Acidimicrobiia bacterium]MDQ3293720.1 SpoIIE family protein phosphatase [Actinomycetota bacterium]
MEPGVDDRAGRPEPGDPDDRDALVAQLEEARHRAERLASHWKILADAGASLESSMDPPQIVRRLTELVVPALADGCEVTLVEPDGAITRVVRAPGVDEDRLRRRETTSVFGEADHPIAEALRSGKATRLASGPDAPGGAFGSPDDDTSSSSMGINEAAIVPLVVRGTVVGALALGVGPSGRHLPDDVIDLATELGARAALCLDNARLFARQRHIADTLQRSLVPVDVPRPGWIDLAGRYWVPGSGVDVGGDFYDVVETGGDLTLVIGDVCGKGIEAASLTALARHTLRAVVAHLGDSAMALRWLHDSFRTQAPHSFVSVAMVRLARNGLRVCAHAHVAGHPRPIVVRADGSASTIEPGGTAPGLPVWRAAPEVGFELAPGDALVLYTDGVTDVPGDAALSAEQLVELVGEIAGATTSADDLATGIGARLEQVRPRRERIDDIALLVARVPEP